MTRSRRSASRSSNFRRSIRSPAGSSTIRRASGPPRSRPRAPRWRAPASRPRTSRRSASPTSARPRSCGTARPASRSTTRSSGRTAARTRPARRCARAGHEKLVSERTGLLLDPYFSATKIAWLLDNVPHAREAAEAGKLAFGTVDTYLLWHLTGGKVHATDATNASRTLLLDIRTGAVGRGTARRCSAFRPRCCPRCATAPAISAPRCRICSARRCASSASRATSRPRPSGRAASSPA